MSFFKDAIGNNLKLVDGLYISENRNLYEEINNKKKTLRKYANSSSTKRSIINKMNVDFASSLMSDKDLKLIEKYNDSNYTKIFTKVFKISPDEILKKGSHQVSSPYSIVFIAKNNTTEEIETVKFDSDSFQKIGGFLKQAKKYKRLKTNLSLNDIQDVQGGYFGQEREDLNGCLRRDFAYLNGLRVSPAKPWEIKTKMEDMLYDYRNSKINILEKIALFHLEMVSVQPFPDANKRTCSIITNMLLVQEGFPTVAFKEFGNRDYRNALCDSLEEKNATKFINYFANKVDDACDNQLSVLRQVVKNNKADKEQGF